MTLVKGSIGLGIRERHPTTNQSEYSQDAIKRWLDDLPMANLGELSRRVYHRLLESNGLLLDAKTRSRVLISLQDSIDFICNALKKHYTGQSVSLTAKQRKVANLSQAIQLELAIGHKTIIEDLLSDEKYSSALLPNSVNYALHYLHKVQIRSYQLYSDLPQGIWYEIHLLYQLAEQNQFHEKKIGLGSKTLSTINTYKKILLIATTNPNQLRQRDIDIIANALAVISKNCKLGSDPDADYDFIANLHADAPPFHRALIKDGVKAHYRGISVSNIVTFLQQELMTAEKQKRKTEIDDSTLRHLLRAWGTMATRAFTRTSHSGSIQVSVGLAASHYLISNELYDNDEFEHEIPEGQAIIDSLEGSLKDAMILSDEDSQIYNNPKASHPEWNAKNNGPAMKTDHMWDSVYRKRSSLTVVDETKPFDFLAEAGKKNSQYDYQNATIINVSPGGYCLKLDGLLPKQTQTGEVIGLLELNDSHEHTWNIGTIRWMKRHDTGELQLGVQLIAPNAVPIFAQVRTSHSDEHGFQRCLLLPALIGIGQPPTILTSTIPFSTNNKVRLKEHDGNFDIKLTKLVSSGHSFQQFEYQQLQDESIDDNKDIAVDDFDSVWDII